MPTVAEQLRRAREEQKLNVYQVAEITKIKTDHIRALEAGQFDSFAAPVYIRGFVRSYAKVLKLDVAHVLADLDAELGQTEKFRELPPLTNEPRGVLDFMMLQLSKMNWRIVVAVLAVAIAILLAVVGVRGCKAKTPTDPLRDLGPGLYQSKPDQSGEVLALPTNSTPRR